MSAYLLRELASVRHDETRDFAVLCLKLVQNRQHEHGRLPHTCFGLPENILSL